MKTFRESYGSLNMGNAGDLPQESFHKHIDGLEFDVSTLEVKLKTIDGAVIKWFDQDYPISVRLDNGQSYKVPAIWSSSDRFSMMNSEKHLKLRDEHGTLILPLISVKRNSPELVAERTAAIDKEGVSNFRVYVREYVDARTMNKHYRIDTDGNKRNPVPIVEVIEIVAPKIVKLTYNINCWSKKVKHSNDMLENVIINFGQHHAVFVNENLFFGAWLSSLNVESNEDSLNNDERIFNTSCDIIVEAPLITEDSIRRFKPITHVNVTTDVSEVLRTKEESDAIRDMIDWTHPYKLRR